MASSSDVVKKIIRFKFQLADTAEPATVVRILQKLKDLDITLDILAETGIGKTVNSLRRHKQAGEFAKSLVKGWKKLVPKETISSYGEGGVFSETVSVKNKEDDQTCPENGSFPPDVNNNCFSSNHKNGDSSDETPFKTCGKKADLQRGNCHEGQRNIKESKKYEKSQQENYKIFQKDKYEIQEDKWENSGSKKKNRDSLLGNKNLEGTCKRSRSDSREKFKDASDRGRFGSERESNTKSKPSKEWPTESKKSLSSNKKDSKMLKAAKDDRSSRVSSEAQNRKKKKKEEKHDTQKYKQDYENNEHSQHKKAKMSHKDGESNSDKEEPAMSFESCLNYDVNALKRKEQTGVKKTSKKFKTAAKEQPKDVCMKPVKLPAAAPEQTPQESLMHLMDVPLPAALPDLEKPSSVDYYYERKVEREPDFCDASEESAVFTGQRLNRKMQVYSGAKTLFLPTMMSLYQQCIRTLQNNINLLYETGGVPFELLEPVLERCTPEQLLRIEECNPIYIGVTDHLWGKHCQRDFKDFKLQEYESWKEMYIRLSEEREKKLQRLTKTIVSAQSKKLKGRQVKMAFIHTVAKPPRDVRIQQEIHGTAVQQPHQLKCSTKVQDNQMRSSYNELNRPRSTSSGGSNTPEPRKKTRVAPMMAKSLKAFKKLGRR
ncbi:elongin A, like [Melanotaenia boesemani]|uniref:elongin A, like n=1 Tax=Melanotaenia boesemani TaxID=1250792 RepID=UPI001C055E6A|nr:elongin A, like [Melanotaenia boesemani]